MSELDELYDDLDRAADIDTGIPAFSAAKRKLPTMRTPTGETCKHDGIAFILHPVCAGCGALAGPGHPTDELTVTAAGMRCKGCNKPAYIARALRRQAKASDDYASEQAA